MTFKEVLFFCAEFQTSCLDIHGWLEYMKVEEKYLSTISQPDSSRELPLPYDPGRMGIITSDFSVADNMYQRGTPCWYVRPSTHIVTEGESRTNFRSWDPATPTPPQVVLDQFVDPDTNLLEEYPVIATGLPSDDLYRYMQKIGCRIANISRPTAIGLNSFKADHDSQAGPSRHQPTSHRSTPYPSLAKSSKSVDRPRVSNPPIAPNHQMQRFHDITEEGWPAGIHVWVSALQSVDTTAKRHNRTEQTRFGFGFPDPAMLLNGDRLTTTLAWLLSRGAHISKLFDAGPNGFTKPPDLSCAHWKEHLFTLKKSFNRMGVKLPNTTPISPINTSPRKGNPSSPPSSATGPSAKAKHRRRVNPHFQSILDTATQSETFFWFEQTVQIGSQADLEAVLSPAVVMEVVWELYETNFRLELLFLDRLMARKLWPTGADLESVSQASHRDMMVRSVFAKDAATNSAGYILSSIPTRDSGLAANRWQDRRDSLLALHALMVEWEDCPRAIKDYVCDVESEQSVINLERILSVHYCQTFFERFGRAPVILRRLPPPSQAPTSPRHVSLS